MNKFFKLTLVVLLACGLAVGCKENPNSLVLQDPSENKNLTTPVKKCVQIFFDDRPEIAAYGQLQGLQAYNLLGHFKQFERRLVPLSDYIAGQLDLCAANIYLGSDYYAAVPQAFLTDFKTTKSRVAWLGYSFWHLGPDLENIFGVQFSGFSSADRNPRTGEVDFFQDILYRGEVFKKYLKTYNNGDNECACEIAQFAVTQPGRAQTLAQVRHTRTRETLPWALRAGNKFLFAELPFNYAHEGDRYLVFADLLFDLLEAQPLRTRPPAVIRFEDIHMRVSQKNLRMALDTLKAENITPHLSLIPFFHDPLGAIGPATLEPIPMTDDPQFTLLIQNTAAQGAVMLWHGVTHQFGQTANPENGASGNDYEFWDMVYDRPVPNESENWVADRLDSGQLVFKAMNLDPKIWLTPHYTASHTSNTVFAKRLFWTIGRSQYFANDLTSRVTQFYPYEITSDAYGAYVFPENLGYVSNERSVEQILSDAKRNLVLRDVWASVFFHPYLLEADDEKNSRLLRLVRGLKDLGYEFVNLEKQFLQTPTSHLSEKSLRQNLSVAHGSF